ncbi:hypothetical protein CTheo_8389 [Ceratobasidium theobromae]|uniref:Uncharacterized protein n=1 Tax=Ceratobasidium theobromae TaxID=1582974 RepID=A0A5N5Q9T3_9AGAM|nr:hypothetical protein CTheo_8389 [Ceratobasidium theobromae]
MKHVGSSFILELNSNSTSICVGVDDQRSLQKRWRFERIGPLPPGELETSRRDQLVTQRIEQIAQSVDKLVGLTSQLVNQNQKMAEMSQEIQAQKRQIEEKDRQLADANNEVIYMRARLQQGAASPPESRGVGMSARGQEGHVLGEAVTLQEKVERLEGLVAQLMDSGNKMPKNMT